MKFLHNKFLDKYNIKYKILAMFISIIALSIMMIKTNSITAYAVDEDIVEAVIADVIGTSGGGSSSRVQNGISYARTGYLCYLLTEDGATIPGMQAKAFYSSEFSTLPGAVWKCNSKKGGYTAAGWTAPAPWELPPFNNDKSTNVDQIKAWMLEMGNSGAVNGVQFVKDNWGLDIAQHFMDGEYVLVLETILHFQPSVSNGSSSSSNSNSSNIPWVVTADDVAKTLRNRDYMAYIKLHGDEPQYKNNRDKLFSDAKEHSNNLTLPPTDVLNAIARQANTELASKSADEGSGGKYQTVGQPIIGTCTDCIEYEKAVGGSPNIFASYTNNVACFAEYIEQGSIGERAGFTPWTGQVPTKISDADVKTYGVAMAVFKATDNDAIHTYWSAYNSPGKEEDAPPNKVGTYNMVKVYYTKYMKNGSLDHEEQDGSPYVELNCIPTISVDEEPNEWHLEHWSTNTDLNTSISYSAVRSMTGPQHGEGAKIVKLSPERNEKTVYVVLVRIKNEGEEETDYNYLMTQSMVTRTIWMDFPDNKLDMEMLYDHEFTWKSLPHPEECEGHSCEHTKEEEYEDEETGETKTREVDDTRSGNCTEPKWEEHKIKFSLYNTKKYDSPSIVATRSDLEGVEIEKDKVNAVKRWEPRDNWHREIRPDDEMLVESTYETAKKPWDYICVLIRGADKLTVAQTANAGGWIVNATAANEELANASSEGFAVADTKTGMRKTDDYYEHFDNYFTSDAAGDYQTKVKYTDQWSCTKCGTEFGICYDTEEYTLSTPLSVNNVKVKIEVYSGNPNGGWENTDLDSTAKIVKSSGLPGWADDSVNTHSGRMVNAGNKISFLPYILMKYQTRASGWAGWHDTLNNKTAGWKKAYVLGQYTRSINPNDYAEIHWDEKDQPNMSLLSNQWSTHALATNCWGTNNVLPGGATLGLKIKTSDRQEVYVTTLQCYTDGYGRDQCEKTGGDPGSITREDCVSTHSEFVRSVANSLDNTNVQQWQSDEVHDEYAWDDGQKVNRGESLDGLNTSGKRSSDDLKYYFGDLREGSNRGDYDVNIESTVTHTYTFYSDVNGAIHMTIDNTSPSEYEDDGAYSAIANAINERTLVRDKLIDAVEQSVNGDDTNKNDKDCFDDKALNGSEWYNEEFDGITVIVQETKITTGFLDPAERTEVLDPKLTQEQKSKGKQFGMEYDNKAQQQGTYELGQFKTRNYSENWGADNPEIMAVFKGSTVAMHNLEYFYWTRRFWIPNLTVQDLY